MVTQIRDPAGTISDFSQLDMLLRQLPIGALVAEAPSGRLLFANERAQQLWLGALPLAHNIDEYSGLYVGYYANGRQYAADEWPLARAILHGEIVAEEEIEFRFASGDRRIMLVSATPLYNEHGDITRGLALFRDVTEQRHEERRREFLMLLTDDLRLHDDAIAIMESAAVMTGEHLGVSSASYADIDDAERHALVHAEYRNGRVATSAKYYLEDFGAPLVDKLRRGESVVVEDITSDAHAAQDLFDGWGIRSLISVPVVRQGRLVALFSVLHSAPRRWTRADISLVQNVAVRTWHAVENTRAHTALRRSKEWLSLALRAGSAAIWEWNLRTGEICWSEEHDALLGLGGARRALNFTRWLALVHPDDRARAQETARRVAAMREGEIEFDYRIAGLSEPRWITMRGRILADPRGLPYRVVGVAVNTTERKRTELEREALLRDAREASDAKSHFIGVISHEFRTPLTAIIGYTDLLSTGVSGSVSPVQARQLDRIRASAWHLTQMVDEILTFSRLDAGRESLSFELTDVVSLARDAAALMSPGAAAKGLSFVCELPDESIALQTDSGKLRQVLLNLLSNAVKFTVEGGITLRVRRDGAFVEFAVQDTGIGIAESDREHVFERFWQAQQSPTRTVSGAGLGLTVSRSLVELLGGALAFDSELGVGTTFRFRIPI